MVTSLVSANSRRFEGQSIVEGKVSEDMISHVAKSTDTREIPKSHHGGCDVTFG